VQLRLRTTACAAAPAQEKACNAPTSGNTTLRVTAKLHQLKGNASYFSITADEYENQRFVAGGCMHEAILARWPDLAPLVALHLSDDRRPDARCRERVVLGGHQWQAADAAALATSALRHGHGRSARQAGRHAAAASRSNQHVNDMQPRWAREARGGHRTVRTHRHHQLVPHL
jgi:hypothetical protein